MTLPKPGIINPAGWAPPKGYNNGVVIEGRRTLCIAGQIAWDANQQLMGGKDFAAQFAQALRNVRAVAETAGGGVTSIGKLTIYVPQYGVIPHTAAVASGELGRVYREVFGKHYPAMALVVVHALLEPGALVEIEALAVLP